MIYTIGKNCFIFLIYIHNNYFKEISIILYISLKFICYHFNIFN